MTVAVRTCWLSTDKLYLAKLEDSEPLRRLDADSLSDSEGAR